MKISVILWKSYTNDEGRHPVRLRVSNGDKMKYYPVLNSFDPVYMNADEFEAAQNIRTKAGKLLQEVKDHAYKCAPSPFNYEGFEAAFLLKSPKDFYSYWIDHIAPMKESRPGTYLSYLNALNKWKKFRERIDPVEVLGLLPEFAETIKGKATRGFYLRATRAIYNALRKKLRNLPEWNYQIKSKVSTHKGEALPLEELKAFIRMKGTPAQMEAKRIWLISFYAGGMNVTDILHLRHEHIKGDRIVYQRSKTRNTKDDFIEVVLSKELKALIGNGLGYVVPSFNREGDPMVMKKRVNNFISNVNERLRILCEANDITPVTTYAARHSFASLMKAQGIGVQMIAELLGHSDIRTTESYLKRFDFETKRKAVSKVLKFKTA